MKLHILALAGMLSLLPLQARAETTALGEMGESFTGAIMLSDRELSGERGTFLPESLNNVAQLDASSSNNVSIGSITGSNSVSDAAFNNTSGLVNVIQNSGNNVIIQSSTILNVTFAQ